MDAKSRIVLCDFFSVPNVSISSIVGLLAPMKKARDTSTFLASFCATIFFAKNLAAYAADLSTFVGSFPEKAPPPTLAYPPYVSTIIFRPVTPVSAAGPE